MINSSEINATTLRLPCEEAENSPCELRVTRDENKKIFYYILTTSPFGFLVFSAKCVRAPKEPSHKVPSNFVYSARFSGFRLTGFARSAKTTPAHIKMFIN